MDQSHEPKLNGVFSRENLPIIEHGVYVINLDDKQSTRRHWVSPFIDKNTAVYYISFRT